MSELVPVEADGDAVVVGLHARRQIQQRVDVAIDQRQALDRRGVDGLRDLGGASVLTSARRALDGHRLGDAADRQRRRRRARCR